MVKDPDIPEVPEATGETVGGEEGVKRGLAVDMLGSKCGQQPKSIQPLKRRVRS